MSTRTIKLTRGKVALVDDEDFERLSAWKWRAYNRRGTTSWYALANAWDGTRRIGLRMHRVVLGLPPGERADHINGDGLDNRRSNLRPATPGQNMFNKSAHRGSSSRFKGVCWSSANNKWVARIQAQGHQRHLGSFLNEADAAHAYDSAARELHGGFAKLNFQDGMARCDSK